MGEAGLQRVSCPSCGAAIGAKPRDYSRTLSCPKCGGSVTVPAATETADDPAWPRPCLGCVQPPPIGAPPVIIAKPATSPVAPPEVTPRRTPWPRRWILIALAASAVVAFAVWDGTYMGPNRPGWPVILNYAALVACCASVVGFVCFKWFSRRVYLYACPPVVLVAFVWAAACDQYTAEWNTIQSPETGKWVEVVPREEYLGKFRNAPKTLYEDTYRRWTGRHLYRKVSYYFYEPIGTFPVFFVETAEGPMSESGKQHGQWKMTTWKPFQVSEQWYWYGEQVSEGEWHTRNRD